VAGREFGTDPEDNEMNADTKLIYAICDVDANGKVHRESGICTWGEFHTNNQDAFDVDDFDEIIEELSAGNSWVGGGGAAPSFRISVVS
jgi:hypothetical protein